MLRAALDVRRDVRRWHGFGAGVGPVRGVCQRGSVASGAGRSARKELAVRIALGGGGWRVARQLLVETVLLSLAGAGLGLLLAQFLMEKVSQFGHAVDPRMDYGIRLDYRVLAFSGGALLLAVLVAGVGPALHATRLNISDVLKQTQGVTMRRRGWQQKALVTTQIAVSVTL